MNILCRKPRPGSAEGAEVALIKRDHDLHPFVVATITPHSLSFNEWCWGHYFATLTDAAMFYASYPENRT